MTITVERDAFSATVIEIADVLVAHGLAIEAALHESAEFVCGLIRKALAEVPVQRPEVDAALADMAG